MKKKALRHQLEIEASRAEHLESLLIKCEDKCKRIELEKNAFKKCIASLEQTIEVLSQKNSAAEKVAQDRGKEIIALTRLKAPIIKTIDGREFWLEHQNFLIASYEDEIQQLKNKLKTNN